MASIKKQSLISVALLGGAAAITAILFLNRPPAQMAEPEYRPVTVDVAVAVKETIQVHVQAQGTVSPLRETAMLAEVSSIAVGSGEGYLSASRR